MRAVCHMNKNFNQTAGQVANKSYLSCVVRATDIAMEAYNNSHWFNLSTGQVTNESVASPDQNELVIGLEARLLLTRCMRTFVSTASTVHTQVFSHELQTVLCFNFTDINMWWHNIHFQSGVSLVLNTDGLNQYYKIITKE